MRYNSWPVFREALKEQIEMSEKQWSALEKLLYSPQMHEPFDDIDFEDALKWAGEIKGNWRDE